MLREKKQGLQKVISSILKTYTSTCLYIHKTFPEGNEKLLAIFDYRKGIDIWDKIEMTS